MAWEETECQPSTSVWMFGLLPHPKGWLDPKAKKTIFLGYGTVRKGYRLYDRKKRSIVHSRDVVFNESSRGYESEEEKRLIQVENFTEEEIAEAEASEAEGELNEVDDEAEAEKEPEKEKSTDHPVPTRASTREQCRRRWILSTPMTYGISWSYLQTEKPSAANGYSRRKLKLMEHLKDSRLD